MKVWKKIVIVNLVVTLVIMGFFIWIGLHGLYVEDIKLDHYEKYQKLQSIYGPYDPGPFWDDYIVIQIDVYLRFGTIDDYAGYPFGYDGYPTGIIPERELFEYIEVYGKAKNNSYILLDNRTKDDSCFKHYYNYDYYEKEEFIVGLQYKNITECPLLLTNPHYERVDTIAWSGINVTKYDGDIYAVAYFNKPIYVKQVFVAYGYITEQIYQGLYYSAIAFVIIWILAFIIWVITHNVISFVKWLKR